MQFDELRVRVELLCKLGGWSNTSPEPDYPFLVNEGLRIMSRMVCHNVDDFSITTVANTKTYLLDTAGTPAWISINDDVLKDSQAWIPQSTRDQIRVEDRMWRMTPAGTVCRWYWELPGAKIGFHPTPSGIVTITGEGPRHEPLLDDDTDTPLLNEDFHEGICLCGAWYQGKLYARGEERAIAEAYRAEGEDYAEKAKSAMASQEATCVVRRVSRAPAEYLGIGSKQLPVYWP